MVLPLVLVLTLGAIEYGWLFLKTQQVHNAARNGARVAARMDATAAEVEASVNALMTQGNFPSGSYTMTITPGDPGVPDPGEAVQVQVRVSNYPGQIALFNIILLPLPNQLNGTVSMAKEG